MGEWVGNVLFIFACVVQTFTSNRWKKYTIFSFWKKKLYWQQEFYIHFASKIKKMDKVDTGRNNDGWLEAQVIGAE